MCLCLFFIWSPFTMPVYPLAVFEVHLSVISITCFLFSLPLFSFFFPSQEGKDKSFLLDKLQNLQKSQPKKKPKQKNPKKVCRVKPFMLTNHLSP